MIISLTGFMGCGKSSVGRELSSLLSCSYADLDAVIEESSGRQIPDIFANDGEAAFRQMELQALRDLTEGREQMGCRPEEEVSFVLALGGGAVCTPECADLVRNRTFCVYLRTSLDTLADRLNAKGEAEGRPMLKTQAAEKSEESASEALRKRISELMDRRSSIYESTAHLTVDTDGKSIAEVAQEIIESVKKQAI